MRSWEQDSGTESRDAASEFEGFARWEFDPRRLLLVRPNMGGAAL
jgi:hypothetical protein